MKTWSAQRLADAAHARVLSQAAAGPGPEGVSIDSRSAGPGVLFVGLPGTNVDGGRFAAEALAAGAWGVLVTETHARAAAAEAVQGTVLACEDPLRSLQSLAAAWRQELAARVIGVTGSTGKTSTKDLLRAILAPQRRTVASRANLNTEIGLPLEILSAPTGTEVLVLEMAMRGRGQIAELAEIAAPEVGVIVNVGPVHLELLHSIEAIAAAKAELIAGLPPGGSAIIPAQEPLLTPYLRHDVDTITFGSSGDVHYVGEEPEQVIVQLASGRTLTLTVPFAQMHLRSNLLAAIAAAEAIGVVPSGRVDLELSPGRGQRVQLPGDVTLIDDCYNANPMSMRAALDELARTARSAASSRVVAVLGDMLELGPEAVRYHRDIGLHADRAGVDVLVTVGPLAAAMGEGFAREHHPVGDATEASALLEQLLQPHDVVLVKASRGVGLDRVCRALAQEVSA